MPISFKDKNSKKHVFPTHADFVTWLKKNRPDIKDPDAFAANIERRQSKGASTFAEDSLDNRSRILTKNLITGELMFTSDDNISVENIEIFLNGIDVPIVVLEPEIIDFGARFNYVIDTRASVGTYSVVWNILLNGLERRVVDSFMIGDDNIDRTLPLELQHLA